MISPDSSDAQLRRLVKQVNPEHQDLHLQKLHQFREQAKAFATTPTQEVHSEAQGQSSDD